MVELDMFIGIAVDDYNATAVTDALAALYRVEPSLITLEARAGSVQLTATIATSPPEAGSSHGVTLGHILGAIHAASDEDVANALGKALGHASPTVTTSAPRQATARRTVEFVCPKGKWCTAGRVCEARGHNAGLAALLCALCRLPVHAPRCH